jgi:hypothetical protein
MNALTRCFVRPSRLLARLAPLALALSFGAAGTVGAGCAEEKKPAPADADAGAQGPQKPVLDGKLAAAVQAAESAQPASASKDGADGPPESGVFGPGLADKAMPPGAPAKMEILGDGREPRSLLVSAPADEQKEGVSLTVRIQQGAIPGDFALALKVDKPKDDKKTDGPRSTRVVGKIASASAPPQAPRDLSDKLGKLKGGEVHYTLGPDGGVSDVGFALGKDADPGLGDLVVKALVDAIGVSMPPLPKKPVGVGAFWMVTDRSTAFGVEVVRYRVYKIERLDKDGASFSVDVRQYAAKDDADLGALGGGQKMTLQRFESSGKAKVEWTAAGLLPSRGETSVRTGLGGQTGGQQGVLQAEVQARFAAGGGDKK